MNPRISELLTHLDAARERLTEAVSAVPAADRERRPEGGSWSVAEVVDHLARVEGGVARLVSKLSTRARDAGLGPETDDSPILGRLDGRPIADPSVPREAPEFVRPRTGIGAAEAESALATSRAALREALVAADGLPLGELRAEHAALGELDLYQWVLFVGHHERRHAAQVARIAAALREAGASAEGRP